MIAPLKERLITHLYFKCENHILKGVEANAGVMHCSARHLQRVLNELEGEGLVKKVGKGSYQLIESPAEFI